MIDWTFNAGQLFVEMVPWAVIGLWFAFGTRGKADDVSNAVSEIKTNFATMQLKLNELISAVSTIPVAEQKITAVNSRLDDEKKEGAEFRKWLRDEIARMWGVIGELSKK